ncbi:MAG: exodeoxyribonuclease VII large subunit [Candidatus Sedimenticola sp. (ex Thyasira tokunagai)]
MPTQQPNPEYKRDIYSVSRLNSEVRAVLEGSFPLLWVEGEISNLARPSSGHIYFSLKDPQAQVRCAMFRMKRARLRFQPENGLKVLIRARVGLYEGRGEFQLVAEHMEPAGEGALRQAFEALKQQLAAEGLFDTATKKELPAFPRQIGIITSPSGAAVRDVLTVLKRRAPAIPVMIYPTAVQGDGAAGEIIEALRLAERREECDLLILTRGGGSLEDLMAFNNEQLARTIHQGSIPVISAVGHEIDFTIADFVADRRAPTPSAAAEMASRDGEELGNRLIAMGQRLALEIRHNLGRKVVKLDQLQHRLNRHHPGMRLQQLQQRLDELERRQLLAYQNATARRKARLTALANGLRTLSPANRLVQFNRQFNELALRLNRAIETQLQRKGQQLSASAGKLDTLSPLATLQRGYSITRTAEGGVVLSSNDLSPGDQIETLLANGSLTSRVETVD